MERVPERVFLGWSSPGLVSASAELVERFGRGGAVDLGEAVVVAPGGRARRMLLAMLAERCEASGLVLTPPLLATPGEVGEILLSRRFRVAPPLVRRLAWVEALRGSSAGVLEGLVGRAPEPGEVGRWSSLAGVFERASDELAGELVLLGDVERLASTMVEFGDGRRWRAAAALQVAYERTLGGWGFEDPSLARLRAVRGDAAVDARCVVLVGAAELNRATRTLLAASAAAGGRVLSLVFAPGEMEDRFDALGCVRAEAWSAAPVEIDDGCIRVAEGSEDQADAAFEALAELDEAPATDEVVFGVPDRSVSAYLRERAGRYTGVDLRDAAGTPMRHTAPYRLLAAIGVFLEEGTFEALAALVRHADMEAAIDRRMGGRGDGWWLEALDRFREDHLPRRVDGDWVEGDEETEKRVRSVRRVHREVVRLLGPLRARRVGEESPVGGLGEWLGACVEVLGRVYGGVARDRFGDERLVVESCLAIREAASSVVGSGAGTIEVGRGEAIGLLLGAVRGGAIADAPDDETIEMLGWLELALDPAPVKVVTGMNEGVVPSTVVGDALLPDRLRRVLGLADDERRCARDAYLLSAIVGSSTRAFFVVGRRNPEGDPLHPSRLLLRCDDETLIGRLARMTSDRADPVRRTRVRSFLEIGLASGFRPGPMVAHEPVESMSVTSFKRYLASPYEFYVARVLRLRERDDSGRELDGAAFGSLVHAVLDRFGRGSVCGSADEAGVIREVEGLLASEAVRTFGASPSAAVAVQVEMARRRLVEFARWQARRAREGWRLEHTEWSPESGAVFEVDGRALELRGKIDRIDRHEDGRLAILDYKTGENAVKPKPAHRGRDGRWRDLQLPLYRHLAAEIGGLGPGVELGYVVMSKSAMHSELLALARWSEAELRDADSCAREVVRRVRRGEFEDLGRAYAGDGAIASLCGVGLLGTERAEAGGEEGERGE